MDDSLHFFRPALPAPDRTLCAPLYKAVEADFHDELEELIASAADFFHPCAVYRVLEPLTDAQSAQLDGVRFDYPYVADKLKGSPFAVPYVITCGPELEQWSVQFREDPLASFWAEELKKIALNCVGNALHQEMRRLLALEENQFLASLNPGSIKPFPIEGQKPLFTVLGEEETARLTGVRLQPSMLMLPYKTGSGIYFLSDREYHNCMLCPRDDCPNRRAPKAEGI